MKLKHTNSTTEKLLITKRDNSFIKIFNIIDGDQDGYISRISNNFQKLPEDLQNLLIPIKIKLEKEIDSLDRNEFFILAEEIFEVKFF